MILSTSVDLGARGKFYEESLRYDEVSETRKNNFFPHILFNINHFIKVLRLLGSIRS